MSSSKLFHKLSTMAIVSSSALLFSGGYCFITNDEKFFKSILMPTTRLLDSETAHSLAVKACKLKLIPQLLNYEDPVSLNVRVNNIFLRNPIGIAAGFDKNGEAVEALQEMGFGWVEIGSVTPLHQQGNNKPRVFRLVEDEAIINRYGFNSDGHELVWHRLQKLRANRRFDGVIGVNLGKNKTSENAVKDYTDGIKLFAPVSDYLVINISSPNTPGLRNLQHKESLKELMTEVVKTNQSLDFPRPIFLKLSPDLTEQELKDICQIVTKKESKADGLIISNTTVDRSMILNSVHCGEDGGLSGKPIKEKSTKLIEEVYKLTKGKVPIIGVGGVSSGQDAYEKILAGASAVQIYTSFVYEGPPVVTKVKKELDALLKQNGFATVSDATGKGVSRDKKSWFSF